MPGCRLLVAMVAGRACSTAVCDGPAAVPWAPGVRARVVDGGVVLDGAVGPGDAPREVAIGAWARVRGVATACLAARRGSAGRVDGVLGPDLVGSSPAMLAVFFRVVTAARSCEPVLLLGETGTGKDLLARALHDLGPRAAGPFVALNLAALPGELVESELFGCVRGAFTGADRGRPGAFEAADGGTLFLDELAEASAGTQAKLLRAVETGCVRRIGSQRDVRSRVRLVAATHRDPAEAVARGVLRADLMERLACLVVRVPPLRERPGDLPALAARLAGGSEPDPATLAVLAGHGWPGNVRELRNVLGRASWLAAGAVPDPDTVREAIATGWRGATTAAPAVPGTRQRQIAESGLPRSTFYYRLKRQGEPGSNGAGVTACAS